MKSSWRLLAFFALFLSVKSFATHLRAGEITATRISNTSLTYRVTLVTYTDELNGKSANDAQEEVDFFFGVTSSQVINYTVKRKLRQMISATTVRNVYDTTFTFQGPGTYKISCGIQNRNEATINLPQPSDNITFFVQSTIVINSFIGLNSTPVLLNIPVDSAAFGVRYIHNPGAFDIDGDSLAYKLSIPMEDKNEANGVGVPIAGYRDPSTIGDAPLLNEDETGIAFLRIDARTGDLIWDAPRRIGQYNVAFIVEEWRKAPDGSYIKIGEIERDMQIIVVESDNKRPELILPEDICVEAGRTVEFEVRATDPDENEVRLSTTGGVYNVDPSGNFQAFIAEKAAKFEMPASLGTLPAIGKFTWETNCLHVREQAYDVLFKVEDLPGRFKTQLAEIKTIRINVVPPRVLGLIGVANDQGVDLKWNAYPQCAREGKLILYRKEGCSGLNPGDCQQGIPAAWNYVPIGEISLDDTSFFDNTAQKGVIYSYRIVADLQVSDFIAMQSAPSTEFCVGSEIPKQIPVLTQVTVNVTDKNNGEIGISWTRPIALDTANFKGPYKYSLTVTEGLGGDVFLPLTEIVSDLVNPNDTFFVHTGLNTTDKVYKYKLAFYYEGNKLMGEAPAASSVRLGGSPDDRTTRISWEANTPWNNEGNTHLILREDLANPGVFNVIAEVNVTTPNTFAYTDTGEDKYPADGDISTALQNNTTYCYKVRTTGKYVNIDEAEAIGLINNFSQSICVTPADRSAPCAPVLSLSNIGCENISPEAFCADNAFTNKLSWTNPINANGRECRTDISSYNVFYSRFEGEPLRQLAFVEPGSTLSYDHRKNAKEGFAGCYYITAVSSLGIESLPSNTVCADNCSSISFPNVFSPNGDGKNDTFAPMNCPAFIKNIAFEIYNRHGLLVANGAGNTLNWDGIANNGKQLSVGTYYYLIKVQFERLVDTAEEFSYKGWVELMN